MIRVILLEAMAYALSCILIVLFILLAFPLLIASAFLKYDTYMSKLLAGMVVNMRLYHLVFGDEQDSDEFAFEQRTTW